MQDKNKTVVKSMDILKLFRENSKLNLNEIVELSGIPKTSVYRMLGSLEEMEFLKKDDNGKYELGFIFMEFGQLVKERMDIRKVALPTMYFLRDEIGEAVNLIIKEGNQAIYIEKLDTLKPIRVYTRIGRRAPLYGGACPRIILANLPEHVREQYINDIDLVPIGFGTITDKECLRKTLEQDRKNGYSVSHSELQDYSSAVAAPIFDSSNNIAASISLVGPSVRFQEEHLAKLIDAVKMGAKEISLKLGWKP
ncbi:IclR family transcriptional regulator [Clostridium hydrogenum]|uniref:IclR family transcriptional regulator n=1 Tax=Clostridium hydrogenum TaxID=2855764 RepID=UPI001F48EF1B|nr:IclR family transcriptional regulator [Clostridium hydrogenum]